MQNMLPRRGDQSYRALSFTESFPGSGLQTFDSFGAYRSNGQAIVKKSVGSILKTFQSVVRQVNALNGDQI